jgi:hypothetical protein
MLWDILNTESNVNSSSTLRYSDVQNTVKFYLEKYVMGEIGVEL